jgi:hypothetical protein
MREDTSTDKTELESPQLQLGRIQKLRDLGNSRPPRALELSKCGFLTSEWKRTVIPDHTIVVHCSCSKDFCGAT